MNAETECGLSDKKEIQVHPMVCLFDVHESVRQVIEEQNLNYTSATFGEKIQASLSRYEKVNLMPNADYPDNLHEYDVVLMDLTRTGISDYEESDHSLDKADSSTVVCLSCRYPQQVLDPRQFSINGISRQISEILEKESIIIAFCGTEKSTEYEFVEIAATQERDLGSETYSNMSFYDLPHSENRSGNKASIPSSRTVLTPLFEKYIGSIKYESTFFHPTVWKEGKGNVEDENFVPLLFNERDQIISYAYFSGEGLVLIFPNMENKSEFVRELFSTYLPEIKPEVFPTHGQFRWLVNGEYLLPEEEQLRIERKRLEKDYNEALIENEKSLVKVKVKDKYGFLHDLISETGEPLVSAVEKYFHWLGFDNVVNVDETKSDDQLEEDLQVETDKGLLVIEIKGIGGTSTDSNCSQISKIRFRRCKERNSLDVFALYLVNHQRYIPPKDRRNPPFNDQQIEDADSDDRGLLSTYDLYKAYFDIEAGILTKEYVRTKLFDIGLVSFEPENLISLGVAETYYQEGEILIITIGGIEVFKGQEIVAKYQGRLTKVIIESIQLDEKEVEQVKDGKIGIKLSEKIHPKSEIFVQQQFG